MTDCEQVEDNLLWKHADYCPMNCGFHDMQDSSVGQLHSNKDDV